MIKNILVILILLVIFGIIKDTMKEQFRMIYFVPFALIVLIYINTNKHEYFLCKIENGLTDRFKTTQPFTNLRNRTKRTLLFMNKSVKDMINKI